MFSRTSPKSFCSPSLFLAISLQSEFNYFTVGYTLSSQPAGSPRFREALNDQWRNLDVCVNERVDRHNPDYSKYMPLFTTKGRKRVCWNSWIAPHNFEGFFLNLGDMLVKSGDWQTAQKIYANAKLSPDYARWKFRAVLEDHIKHAPANVSLFNAPDDPHQPGKNRTTARRRQRIPRQAHATPVAARALGLLSAASSKVKGRENHD